jgi:hypothetical protein
MQLLIEAASVGFGLLILYIVIVKVLAMVNPPAFLKNLDQQTLHYGTIAAAGILFHLICEFTGVNAWYCKNGAACKLAGGHYSDISYSF